MNTSTPELVVARDGTVVYATGGASGAGAFELVWVDRAGEAEIVDPSLTGDLYFQAVLSPEDDRIALVMADDTGAPQLWVKELPDGPLSRLTTSEGGAARRPVWSPDGRTISFIAEGMEGIGQPHARSITADGSSNGVAPLLLERPNAVVEVFFTPDERQVPFRAPEQPAEVGLLDLETDRVDDGLFASGYDERSVSLSPDGRWMAYSSNASGRYEVFVRPFPEATSRVQCPRTEGPRRSGPTTAESSSSWTKTPSSRSPPTGPTRRYRWRAGDRCSTSTPIPGTWRGEPSTSPRTMSASCSSGRETRRPQWAQNAARVLIQSYFEELRARVGR